MELALEKHFHICPKILFACSWKIFPLVVKSTKMELSFRFEMLMAIGIRYPESWIMNMAEQRAEYASH